MGIDGSAPRAILLLIVLALAPLGGIGCGAASPPGVDRRPVALADVPAPVMKKARQTLPGVSFDEAWKNLDRDGKLHSFEIRGRTANGKIREARLSATAEVLEIE